MGIFTLTWLSLRLQQRDCVGNDIGIRQMTHLSMLNKHSCAINTHKSTLELYYTRQHPLCVTYRCPEATEVPTRTDDANKGFLSHHISLCVHWSNSEKLDSAPPLSYNTFARVLCKVCGKFSPRICLLRMHSRKELDLEHTRMTFASRRQWAFSSRLRRVVLPKRTVSLSWRQNYTAQFAFSYTFCAFFHSSADVVRCALSTHPFDG